MYKTTLYCTTGTEHTREFIMRQIISKNVEEKISGIRNLICYISQGNTWNNLVHTIVKEILFIDNNDLKRLMYYFLEVYGDYMEDNEMLLLSNQVMKDLESPNEYIRGMTLKYVSTLHNENIITNIYKLVKENMAHSVGYVRRNAYYCMSVIYNRYETYNEIGQILYDALYKEMDPTCLDQAFCALWSVNKEKAIEYASEVTNTKCKELSAVIISKVDDTDILQKFINDTNSNVKIDACLKLVSLSLQKSRVVVDKNNLCKYFDILFNNIKESEEYILPILQNGIEVSNMIDLSKYTKDLFDMINPYNVVLSEAIVKFVFTVCKIKDAAEVCDLAVKKLKELDKMAVNKNSTEIKILKELSKFTEKCEIHNQGLVSVCYKYYLSSNPELSYVSLQAFDAICKKDRHEKIVNFVVDNFLYLQFGKIIRDTLSFIKKFATATELDRILDLVNIEFMSYIQLKAQKASMFKSKNKYLVPYLAIALTEIYWNIQPDDEVRAKLIALLMGLSKQGGLCGTSASSTITLCIKSLLSGCQQSNVKSKTSASLNKTDVCKPIDIPFCRQTCDITNEKLQRFLKSYQSEDTLDNVLQLTGLSDPIYVEANVIYNRCEIVVDLLIINRTDSYIQNILFDFVTSANIQYLHAEMPESMNGKTVVCKKVVFRVLDSSNGFINGSMSFKYSSNSGDYTKQTCTLNFAEIKTFISDFLEVKKCTDIEFRLKWSTLVWENVYTARLLCQVDLQYIFDMFTKLVNGHAVEYKKDSNILVGNISSTTRQNNDILFNVCMSKSYPYTNVECRIRSGKEDIVKSMGGVLNQIVRQIKEK